MSAQMLAPLEDLARLHRAGCDWSRRADELGYESPDALRVAAYQAHLTLECTDE